MTEFIVTSIIWILAIYGLIEILKVIVRATFKINFKTDGIYIIIATKNQEEKVEGVLRSFLFRILYGKEEYISKIIVADLDSTDNTLQILEKFQQNHPEINVCDWKTCKEIIEKVK